MIKGTSELFTTHSQNDIGKERALSLSAKGERNSFTLFSLATLCQRSRETLRAIIPVGCLGGASYLIILLLSADSLG